MKKISLIILLISAMFTNSVMAQRIVASDVEFLNGTSEANLEFSIVESDRLAAIAEFVITLPDGFTLKPRGRGFANTINLDMADGFASTINKRDNGDFYVLLSCNDGYEFIENNGKLITLTLVKDESVADGVYTANVHDIILGDINAQQMNTETSNEFKIGANTTVGINAINADGTNEPVFNTAGQRVRHMGKGLFIQNGKKVVKK